MYSVYIIISLSFIKGCSQSVKYTVLIIRTLVVLQRHTLMHIRIEMLLVIIYLH